jgi:hypothetical protein
MHGTLHAAVRRGENEVAFVQDFIGMTRDSAR